MDNKTWGDEQFCLMNSSCEIVGYVSCQYDNGDLWVGWSLSPSLCGKHSGHLFVERCVSELRRIKKYTGKLYLRVSSTNKRAIIAYRKAGFIYLRTIQDEIAYSNKLEDFFVMVKE